MNAASRFHEEAFMAHEHTDPCGPRTIEYRRKSKQATRRRRQEVEEANAESVRAAYEAGWLRAAHQNDYATETEMEAALKRDWEAWCYPPDVSDELAYVRQRVAEMLDGFVGAPTSRQDVESAMSTALGMPVRLRDFDEKTGAYKTLEVTFLKPLTYIDVELTIDAEEKPK